ncbi:MAG TPA: helix-turn-helix domain-containing protein [Pseudonocardia sp.]
MRADAARNLQVVLRESARLLGADPGARITDIAAAAGMDRRTIYRRFQSREELLHAIYRARLDALEAVIDGARVDEAPVLVALHALAEGGIRVSREWPVDIRVATEPDVLRRRGELNERMAAFFRRAERDGVLVSGLPESWPLALFQGILRTLAQDLPDLPTGRAADLAVDSFLRGLATEQVPARRSTS